MLRLLGFTVALTLSALVLLKPPARGAEIPAPAELLSPSTAVFVEVLKPQAILDAGLSEQTLDFLGKLEPFQKYLQSKEYQTLQLVTSVLEQKLGTEWRPAVEKLVAGGVTAAFDTSENAVIVFVRSRDAKLLAQLHDAVVELIEADATNKGKDSPVKAEPYNGETGWTFGKDEAHVLLGDTLVVSNKVEALKRIVDRSKAKADQSGSDAQDAAAKDDKKSTKKAKSGATLAGDRVFQAARKHAAADDAGFAFLRMAPLKLIAGLSKVLGQKSNNPLLEVLAGGVIDAVGHADYVAATLHLGDDGLRLAAHLPRDRGDLATTRRWFFAPAAGESAAARLDVPGTIGTFTAYRDVSGMWLARNELFDEKTNVGFTQADTNLGLYFSGKDFGSQVLGELEPRWRLIAAERPYGVDGEPVPALKLPSFALVWELKHPQEFAPHLQMAFQNIVGITNIDGAQKGRPQLLLKSEQRGDAEITFGSYLLVGETDKSNAPVHFNFRPACARVGKHFVIGSHVGLVRDLADQLGKQPSSPTTNDSLFFDVRTETLAKILEANRPLIVGRQMLAAGGNKEKAEEQLNLGLKLLKLLEDASVRLVDGQEALTLEATLRIAGN